MIESTYNIRQNDNGSVAHIYGYGPHLMAVLDPQDGTHHILTSTTSGDSLVKISNITGLDSNEPDYILSTGTSGRTMDIDTLVVDADMARTAVTLFLSALGRHNLTATYDSKD